MSEANGGRLSRPRLRGRCLPGRAANVANAVALVPFESAEACPQARFEPEQRAESAQAYLTRLTMRRIVGGQRCLAPRRRFAVNH